MNKNDLVVIFCLSLSQYPKQPEDISKARPVDCPECKNPMWLSEKKEAWKNVCKEIGKNILFCCSDCLIERSKNDPDFFQGVIRTINI